MTEAVSGPSKGHSMKQDGDAFGFFDSLDILATIATQELKSKSEEKEPSPDSGDDSDRSGGRGAARPRKMSEMEAVTLEQIRAMSSNTLLRLFTETDFDEMKRTYCYTCYLQPEECNAKFQSFGNESKAKKQMRKHLEDCLDRLVQSGNIEFVAEPVLARNRRLKEGTQLTQKPQELRSKKRIKSEPKIETGANLNQEKENSELLTQKKRNEEVVPLLTEISNDQESNRYKIKKETDVSNLFVDYVGDNVKQENADGDVQGEDDDEAGDQEQGPSSRTSIDEDHCYAFRAGRVKAEYWPDYGITSASTFTSIQETEETYDNLKECSDLASVEVIQSCPVVLEEDYTMQGEDMYQQEYTVTTTPGPCQEEIIPDVPETQAGEFIVYQDQVGDTQPQFYTETIVSGDCNTGNVMEVEGAEVRQVPVRIKNKRTVAAVSSEDKRLALSAMEELRARGATTDDLMCRLCDPARPFTAYSTLLTHYRSHAGLRPFECGLCGATFTRQHSLNYHLMTHANQTRFTCPHCNRKFRHPTHFKEHVKKHGEVVQFVCQFCNASLSTQSQYRKHLKSRHNKTIDIMGNVIDSQADLKDKEKARRKRKKDEIDPLVEANNTGAAGAKKKRRRKVKTEPEGVEGVDQYNELGETVTIHGMAGTETGTVVYEETVPITESEMMYHQNSELMETQNGFEIIDNGMVAVSQQNNNERNANNVVYPAVATKTTSPAPLLFQAPPPAPVVVSSQPSPVIFVVPNSGQIKTEPEIMRKPLVVNDQKRPIVVSSLQSNTEFGKFNQGVIAQINGQKVLLVPKKMEGGVQTAAANIVTQKISPIVVKGAHPLTPSVIKKLPQNSQKVIAARITDTVALSNSLGCENQENDDNLNNRAQANSEEKPTILEQAMHEVFPSNVESEEIVGIEKEEEDMETCKEGVDLYNPLRSPLKNRNKILQEVLGIDS